MGTAKSLAGWRGAWVSQEDKPLVSHSLLSAPFCPPLPHTQSRSAWEMLPPASRREMVHAEWEGTIRGPYWDAICNCRLSELEEILKIILCNSLICRWRSWAQREKRTFLRSHSQVDRAGTRAWVSYLLASAPFMSSQCLCWFWNLCQDAQLLLCLLCHPLLDYR